jgi:tetratricopeptide (TPR) repeat protein
MYQRIRTGKALAIALLSFSLLSACTAHKALKPVEREVTLGEEEKKLKAQELFKEGAALLFNDNEKALEKFNQARELDKSFIAAHFNAGLALEMLGDEKRAQEPYESCLAVNKEEAQCLENLVIAKALSADLEAARNLSARYVAEYPEAPFAHVAAAKLAYFEHDLAKAEHHAREAIERDAENVEALYVMARIFFDKKEYAAAKMVSENALKLSPSHGGFQLLLGHTFTKLDRLADALDAYTLAVDYFPSEEALESYALLLLKRGKVKESLAVFERLTKLRPLEARHFLHLGNAAMASKDFDGALLAYETVKRLTPEDKDVDFNLGLLYFDLKPKAMPEIDRLKTAQAYFKAYREIPGLSAERTAEVDRYLKGLGQKIDSENYALESAKEIEKAEAEEKKLEEEKPEEEKAPEEPNNKPAEPKESKELPNIELNAPSEEGHEG